MKTSKGSKKNSISFILSKIIIIIICLFLVSNQSLAQNPMSGTYLIGMGDNTDFLDIQTAMDALYLNGIEATTIIKIQEGTYNERIGIGQIPGVSENHRLIFESENQDATSVIIQHAQGSTIRLINANNITFQYLTIISNDSNKGAFALDIVESKYILVKNCILAQNNEMPITVSSRAAICIESSFNAGTSLVDIRNNVINGNGTGIALDGDHDEINIINNKIESQGKYAIYGSRTKDINVIGNEISKEIYTNFSTRWLFEDNVFEDVVDVEYANFTNNIFYKNATLEGAFADRNTFYDIVHSDLGTLSNNSFYASFFSSHKDNVIFRHNNCYATIRFSFCDFLTLRANKFHDDFSANFSDYGEVFNNFFFQEHSYGHSAYLTIVHNNYGADGKLYLSGGNATVQSNNFTQKIEGAERPDHNISHNNYYPSGGQHDDYPYFIPQNYVSEEDIHAQNPTLVGKGEYFEDFSIDIDGRNRFEPPTIGANEICLEQEQVIEVYCGDKVQLSFCDLPEEGTYQWQPEEGLSDPQARFPIATITEDVDYVVTELESGWSAGVQVNLKSLDSLNFITEDTINLYCGEEYPINLHAHPYGNLTWFPVLGVLDTTIFNPILHPSITTTYIASMDIPNCGVLMDTILAIVDTLPTADFTITYNETFTAIDCTNKSFCADSYQWDFGDNETSTEVHPMHLYDTAGVYMVMLIASNDFGVDTFLYNVLISEIVNTNEIKEDVKLKVFPNPVKDLLTIEMSMDFSNSYTIQLYQANGILVKSLEQQNLQAVEIPISSLPNGIYFLRLITENGDDIVRKILKI